MLKKAIAGKMYAASETFKVGGERYIIPTEEELRNAYGLEMNQNPQRDENNEMIANLASSIIAINEKLDLVLSKLAPASTEITEITK